MIPDVREINLQTGEETTRDYTSSELAAIAAYPTTAPVRVVSPFQFKTALAQLGIISESEVASPALPAVAESAISALPLEDRIKARSRWANMTSAPENDELLVAMCLAAELPLDTITAVFDLAVTIE